jgi:integrase
MLHVKRTKAKGRLYLYFRTGRLDQRGREILAPLPSPRDPGFGASYASFLAARTRRDGAQAAAQELTVTALCQLYERSDHFRRLSMGTQRLYGISLRHLRAMLPTAPAGLLERKDIVRLIDARADQPGAANSLLRAIAAMFKWARERGHLENDPCRDIAELPIGEHEPWPQHILHAALAAEDDRVRLGAHLLFYTAQRIGDVVRMRWTDIFTDDAGVRRIRVIQQKTRRQLLIRLHDALAAELERHPRSLGYILQGQGARSLAPVTLRDSLQAFAARLGAKVVPHGLRKNAVNALLEAGCSVAETAAISGQTMAMVEHYAKARGQQRLGDSAVLKWQGNRP